MVIAIELELKSMSKKDKKTPAGLEITEYTCTLKGNVGGTQCVLTLKSGALNELNAIIAQRMGKIIVAELREVSQGKEGL